MDTSGYPCPACGAPADLSVGCRRCGRAPDPAAAEVIRLDREIVLLAGRAEQARRAYLELAEAVRSAQARRADLAVRVRAATPVGAPHPAGPAPVPPSVVSPHLVPPTAVPSVGPALPVPGSALPVPGPPVRVPGPVPSAPAGPVPPQRPAQVGGAETSTRTVQGLLFVLGGLLLGTAAVVFTAVAWATVGVAGRALILLAFTALALAVPPIAARRGLRGTAETFAAVGLLLVVLDGYAAWSVDLFGVTGWSGARYAALVGGVSAVLAAGYGRLTRLTVPWFAALFTAQPVLPLLAGPAHPSAAGWTVVFVGVAALNLAVVAALRDRGRAPVPTPTPTPPGAPIQASAAASAAAGGSQVGGSQVGAGAAGGSAPAAGRVLAWLGYAGALLVAAGCALVPLAVGRAAGSPLLAGGPLLLVALALLGAALVAGGRWFRAAAAGALVPVLGLALLRPVAELRSGLLTVATALVALALAGAVRALPRRVGTGPRAGALVVAAGAAQVGALLAVLLGAVAVGRVLPPWSGVGAGPHLPWGWQVPVAVALAAVALAALLPRVAWPVIGVVAVAFATLALPGVGPVPWPAVLAAGLVVGAGLLLFAVTRARPWWGVLAAAVAGAALVGHALLAGLASPDGEAALLGAVVPLGLAVAALGRRDGGVRRGVAGAALAAALLAVPAAVTVALFAAGASPWWQARAALAAVGLPLVALLAVRRRWPELTGYASVAFAAGSVLVALAPLVVRVDEPVALYAAVVVLLTVLAGPGTRPTGAPLVSGLGLLAVALFAAAPVLVRVLVAPYGEVSTPWSGAPTGVPVPGAAPAGVALLVLTLAAALAGRAPGRSAADPAGGQPPRAAGWADAALPALPFAAAAVPVLLAAAGAPWPVVSGVLLLTGVAALLAAALVRPRPLLLGVTVPVGLVATAAGLGGLLATRAGTLAGLGALVVAGVVAAVAGRTGAARLAGVLVAVGSAAGFAVTAALAASLPLRTASFAVLAVAVLVLAAAALPAGVDRLRGRVLDVAAQAVALLAVLLAAGSPRYAAAVCVLWGAAVGLRLLRRGEPVGWRWAFAGVAGGSELLGAWLLLGAGGVVLLEAYTLPAAGLALAAGAVALRTRPGLNSWLALGPGLAAGLLPSGVSVLFAPDPQPWRRLLLGAGALAVVLAGAARRWQAPVLLGGVTLVLLALHELVRGWDLLPRWIFLAAGGLALIGLAATYERRRRDLARFRAAVGRMS
ncbi:MULTISPECIES: SCO7613 C-terminal domain-containing membrane protein [unclassified Micromonospora]|uniref:SCO7613 C-terminal domain-containing membrane protein n=1 Tax=unclassified Micromonospora TaxID=2617518 RepID=UPI00363509F2